MATASTDALHGASQLDNPAASDTHQSNNTNTQPSSEEWLLLRVGTLPRNSLGWFRAGVGFYNKREYARAIECFQRAVEMDPNNFNAFQIMARACIALNRKDEAIAALKRSVVLDNPSDWQLLVELTSNLD
ncbi:hypothetical protein SeMB42_g07287 [Synchytrium endobioticum]|uniref:Uncharacterized protein n=1 Tax=Synchytrium endobioticum TaxID=286115 RepID=A0A507CB55_9FUNG|nr:hypothetical protein SeMB42_g07287 [Synchytrium endobioticum]